MEQFCTWSRLLLDAGEPSAPLPALIAVVLTVL